MRRKSVYHLSLDGWTWAIALSLCLTVPMSAIGRGTRASPNVPLHHWTYDVLERLATEGWLERTWMDHRPLTRWEAAQAIAIVSPEKPKMSPVFQNLLQELEEAFGAELLDLKRNEQTATVSLSYAQGEILLMEATSGVQPNVDTYVPFHFEQGLNLGLEGAAGVQITPYVLLFAVPHIRTTRDSIGARLQAGYVKIHVRGTDLQIGRGINWFGPGTHGDFVMTDNAPAFDMIKVSRRMGPWYGCALVGTLRNQLLRRPVFRADVLLGGFRVVWSYTNRLRVEANVGSLSKGGKRIWEDMRSLWQTGISEVNQVGEIGITYWPTDGLKIYATTAGDDFWAVGPARRIIPWGRKSGYILGMYASDLLGDGRMDGRWEFTRFVEERGDNWYTHAVPYLYDGWVIGHPTGHSVYGRASNERDLFLRTTYRWRGATLGLTVRRAWGELPPAGKEDVHHLVLDLQAHRGIWEVGLKAILLTERVRGDRRNEGRWILHLRRRVM